MSNSRFRVAEKAAPEARAELLAQAKRFELINAAIERLFAKRGGLRLEKAAAICEICVDGAAACREADNKRLCENPDAMRARGERPIYTVSEGRLHMRDMMRYTKEALALREKAEFEVMDLVERKKPESEADLRVILDAMVGSSSDETRDAIAREVTTPQQRGEQVIAQMEPEERERMKAAAIEVNKRLSPEQMRELSAAVADLDTNKLMDFVAKQPNDLRELIHEAVFGAKKKQKTNSPQAAMAS
jgi:hypothetical protein